MINSTSYCKLVVRFVSYLHPPPSPRLHLLWQGVQKKPYHGISDTPQIIDLYHLLYYNIVEISYTLWHWERLVEGAFLGWVSEGGGDFSGWVSEGGEDFSGWVSCPLIRTRDYTLGGIVCMVFQSCWLGLSVTVRVRTRDREWIFYCFFFFLS